MKLSLPPNYPLDQVADTLGLKTQAGKEALRIALENIILLDGKQQDYGSKNISRFSAFGCVVRRCQHLVQKNGLALVVPESKIGEGTANVYARETFHFSPYTS